MLGDVAVAVHPNDPRYADLIGAELEHPFYPDRKVVVDVAHLVDRARWEDCAVLNLFFGPQTPPPHTAPLYAPH